MKLIRIDFTEQLGEGQYIEIRDPKFMPWGEQKKIMRAMKDDTNESRMDLAERMVISLVQSGNILDEDDNVIPMPITEQTIDLLPAQVIEGVSEAFRVAKEAVPKK